MRAGDELVAYRVFDTAAPEAWRCRRSSDRGDPGSCVGDRTTRESIAAQPVLYTSPAPCPTRPHLLVLAKQPAPDAARSRRRRRDGVADPGVVELLLAEIFGAPAAGRPDEEAAPRDRDFAESRSGLLGDERLLVRRAAQIVRSRRWTMRAADRLGPLLLARSTPEGSGDGTRTLVERNFRGAWDGATRRERRAMTAVSTESGTRNACCDVRRPRIACRDLPLARASRPSRRARAARRASPPTARAGGWVAICDADDAVKARGPERVWVDRWGLCRHRGRSLPRHTGPQHPLAAAPAADGSSGRPRGRRSGRRPVPVTAGCRRRRCAVGRIVVRHERHEHDAVIEHIDPAGLFADNAATA